jgi:hypothetical protein
VTSSWAFHDESKAMAQEKDFKKLNKMSVHNKVLDSKVRKSINSNSKWDYSEKTMKK